MDLALEVQLQNQCGCGEDVSILVFMDLALEGSDALDYIHDVGVSILVFMDLALEDMHFLKLKHLLYSLFQSLFLWILLSKINSYFSASQQFVFQSLFLWILLSKKWRGRDFETRQLVSILVFMDLALEDLLWQLLPMLQLSFNPCFYGSCSRSFSSEYERFDEFSFQSLFLWILLSKSTICHGINGVPWFQSLFLWILLSKAKKIVVRGEQMRDSFNPCFYGSCSRSMAKYPPDIAFLMGFNPCFYGSCSRRRRSK